MDRRYINIYLFTIIIIIIIVIIIIEDNRQLMLKE